MDEFSIYIERQEKCNTASIRKHTCTHFMCVCGGGGKSGGEQKALVVDLSWSDRTQLCPDVLSVKSD